MWCCTDQLNLPSGAMPASWPPPSADQATRHAAVQRTSGIGAAETEESVTLRRSRKRKRWDSQRSFTPDNVTLGAMGMGVKHYNVGLEKSPLQARFDSWDSEGGGKNGQVPFLLAERALETGSLNALSEGKAGKSRVRDPHGLIGDMGH